MDKLEFNELFKASGLSKIDCGKLLGVNRQTIHNWSNRGKKIPDTKVKMIREVLGQAPEVLRKRLEALDRNENGIDDRRLTSLITLDDDLINRKLELSSLTVFLSDNYPELIKDDIFRMFIDRIKSIARAEYNREETNKTKESSETKKEIIKDSLTEKSSKAES